MAKKEISVDEHNKQLSKSIRELETEIAKLKALYKSEAEKPQATLAECNAIAKKKRG